MKSVSQKKNRGRRTKRSQRKPDADPPFISPAELPRLDPRWNKRWIERYRQACSKSTDAPPDYHRAGALSILASVLGAHQWLRPTTGAPQGTRPNLYTCLVGPSSQFRKSTCVRIARTMTFNISPECVLPNDFSPEALVAELGRRDGRGSILFLPEFAGLIKKTRGSSYHASTQELLSDVYDQMPQQLIRRTAKGSVRADQPHLSMLMATTPQSMEAFARRDDLETGLLARIQFVAPKNKLKRIPFARFDPSDEEVLWDLENELRWKKSLLFERSASKLNDGSGPKDGYAYAHWDISANGFEMLEKYEEALERRMNANPQFSQWYARSFWFAVKIATLVAATDRTRITFTRKDILAARAAQAGNLKRAQWISETTFRGELLEPRYIHEKGGIIHVADVAYAIRLVERLRPGAETVLGRLELTDRERKTQRALDVIKQAGKNGISRTEMTKRNWLDPRDMDHIEETLLDRGQIAYEMVGKGKKQARVYKVIKSDD